MTETPPGYDAGPPAPYHEWIECLVRVPSEVGGPGSDIRCPAKVRCDDVIDALDLDRWSTVAFQHLWRSGRSAHRMHQLDCCLWYLKRAMGDHLAEARSAARLVRELIAVAENDGRTLRDVLLEFARDAEAAEFEALYLVHRCSRAEGAPQPGQIRYTRSNTGG